MKKMIKDLEWFIDFYLMILLYNPNKVHRYDAWMTKKWGTRYTGK